jgi:hypothetical protein
MADGVNPDFDKFLAGPLHWKAERQQREKAAYFAYYAYFLDENQPYSSWEQLPETERARWRQAADAARLATQGDVALLLGVFNGAPVAVPIPREDWDYRPADLAADEPHTREGKADGK